MDDRYGQHEAPKTPAELQRLIVDGFDEALRISRRLVLVKCMDYVSSGRVWLGAHWMLTHALGRGCEMVDRFEHVGEPGPQPSGRREVHARRNASTLFVFGVTDRRRKRIWPDDFEPSPLTESEPDQ